MPRSARVEQIHTPMHITQRGNNRCNVFLEDEDFHHFKQTLCETFAELGIALHAYVLMNNHYHLLLTAPAPGVLAIAMRRVGARYVPYFNWKHGRTGTLWEGRYKSCLVKSERYFLNVQRYIELNPIRANMVNKADDYRWSSVHSSLGHFSEPMITPHSCYLDLGRSPAQRARTYREFLGQSQPNLELSYIRQHIRQSRPIILGTEVPPSP